MTAWPSGVPAAGGVRAGHGLPTGVASGRVHSRWGPVIRARTGCAIDASLRRRAAGGLLPAILLYLLTSRLVEGIIYISADAASPLGELIGHLGEPGRSAVVGRPSDIAIVRACATYDAAMNEKLPYLISFMDADGSGWFADLVCAEILPQNADATGRSLVVTRTEKGEDVVLRAWSAGYLELADIDVGALDGDPTAPAARLRSGSAEVGPLLR